MVITPDRPRPAIPFTGKGAIYTRISSRQQEDGASLSVQLDSCRRYCEQNGLMVVAEFRDIQSGLDPTRPEYMKAIDMARANAIDKLVVWRLDRLGRDSSEYIPLLKSLNRLGVQVASVTQPTESVFMQQVIGVMAEEESRQLSTRVTASKRHLIQSGKWVTRAPFGYNSQRLSDGGCTLVANDESPLVVELFQRYASGKHSLSDLRDYLKEHGHAKRRGAICYILKNPSYIGMIQTGRFAQSQFMTKPEIRLFQGIHEPLVSQELFDQVQQRLSANIHRQRGGTRPKFLFSSLIFCGGCGYRYAGRRMQRKDKIVINYECNGRAGYGDCRAHSVVDNRVRSAVLPPIKALLERLSKEDVRAAVRKEITLQQSAAQASGQQSMDSLAESQRRLEHRLSRLEDSFLDADISRDRYLPKRDEILGQMEEINAALASIPKVATPDLDGLVRFAESIRIDDLDDQSWREIVEAMVEKIVIKGDPGDGRRVPATVEVVWKPEYQGLMGVKDG